MTKNRMSHDGHTNNYYFVVAYLAEAIKNSQRCGYLVKLYSGILTLQYPILIIILGNLCAWCGKISCMKCTKLYADLHHLPVVADQKINPSFIKYCSKCCLVSVLKEV